ncbi:hypothetical protein EJB05_12801, partial [Eragrostis curvula]
MAASSNSVVLTAALLIAFAIAAPNLQPSAAARVHEGGAAAAKKAAAKAAYKEDDAGAMLRTFADQPPIGGGATAAQPTECRPLLLGMMPCAGFLTNPRVYVPERTCCDGFNAMFRTETITCMCHVVNGDINSLLPAPMQNARMLRLFPICGHNIRVDRLAAACRASNYRATNRRSDSSAAAAIPSGPGPSDAIPSGTDHAVTTIP